MKTFLATFALAVLPASLLAQFDPPGLTATSKAYHAYRMVETSPSYDYSKVEKLIKHLKPDSNDNQALPAKTFNKLSLKDRFEYCMLHGDVFSQNCDGMPASLGEEKFFYAHPIGPWGEQNQWSDQQKAFLHKNRSAVIGMLRSTIKSKNRIGCNLKMAVTELDAWELIPDMISVYKSSKKDGDIMSVFFLLMKDGKDPAFLKSATYAKLYGGADANWRSTINANPENANLTIQRAMAYYKGRAK